MHGNEQSALAGGILVVLREHKAIVTDRVGDVGVPAGHEEPAVGILPAGCTDGVHEDLVVGVDVLVVFLHRIVIFAVKFLVHALENEMLVVILELLRDLLPDGFIFCPDGVLIVAVAQEPAAGDGIVAVTVDIDDDIEPVVVAVADDLLHAVKPRRINGIAVRIVDLVKIADRHAHGFEALRRHKVNDLLRCRRVAPSRFADLAVRDGFEGVAVIPPRTECLRDGVK